MTREEAKARFGFDPEEIGVRHRGWWIVERIEDEEQYAGAQIGDLCVKTRDGEYLDDEALKKPNYRGVAWDTFDPTYVYYYFSPLP
ncbi:MAG TPA: hypothetical protein VIK75_00795 [Calditerricola sp.]